MHFAAADVRGRFRNMQLSGTAASLLIRIVFRLHCRRRPYECGVGVGTVTGVLCCPRGALVKVWQAVLGRHAMRTSLHVEPHGSYGMLRVWVRGLVHVRVERCTYR